MERYYVRLAVNGDKQALEYLLNKHRDVAVSIALKYVQDDNEAEDIVQEAFVKVFLNIAKFRNESAFSTWLFRIIYVESVRYLTNKKKFSNWQLIEDGMVYTDHTETQNREDINDKVKLAMDVLSESEYLIINLFYLSEKSIKDISEITNQSQSNIKVKLHRARKKMSNYLKNQDER